MFYRTLFFLAITLGCAFCRPDNSSKSVDDSNRRAETKALLAASEQMTADAILSRLSVLPPSWQDTFFAERLELLESRENDDGIKEALKLYKQLRPEAAIPRSLEHYYSGIFHQYAGKFDSAEWHYNKAVAGFQEAGHAFYLAKALEKSAGNKTTQGRTDDAIGLNYRAIALYDSLGNTNAKMQAQMHLANAFNLKGDFDKVIELLKAPLTYFETQKDSVSLAYILSMQGTALISKKDFVHALEVHRRALAIRQKVMDPSGTTESLYHVGRSLNKLERWQEALDTLRQAAQRVASGPDKQGLAHIETAIGEALYGLKHYDDAERYLLNSLEISLKRGQYPSAAAAARRMSTVRASQKRFEEALKYHEDFVSYKDSVFNQEKIKLSKTLTAQYEAREKELQIATLQKEKKLAVQRNWWIAGSFFLILLAVFYQLRLNASRERLRLEAEKAHQEAEARQLAQQLKIQNLELANHRARLEDFAQMLIDRNRHLQDFSPELPSAHTDAEPVDTESSEILYNQVILTESDWEKFQTYFNKVYPGFIPRLRAKYPDITPGEIRLVLLDKMGLSLKESASILGISVDAVKKGRYRLKKKYELDSDDLSTMFESN